MKFSINAKTVSLVLAILVTAWFLAEYDFSVESNKSLDIVQGTSTVQNEPSQWQEPQDGFSQSDDGMGSVTFTAQYLPNLSNETGLTFEIFLNTHSVDLSNVNFSQDIFIKKENQIFSATSAKII